MPLLQSNQPKPDTEGYYPAGAAADLGHEQMRAVRVDGEPVIVTRLDDAFIAFAATCPHAAGDLTKGEIYRGRIDCPEHGYRFDVRSGRTLWPPDEVCRLRRFDVLERDGLLLVRRSMPAGR